jgi:hypothetical protein
MELADRIELRRFVGRELLLWLWFETELFEATLTTKAHGSFGMWIEGRLVLSAGRESTTIRGSAPGMHREAKEALRRGKLPELSSFHLSWADHESTFVLKGESMALASLSLPTVLGEGDEEAPPELLAPPARRPRKARRGPGTDAGSDEAHEAFYERMRLTRDVEKIVEALYADFLALRLGPAWSATVLPAITSWMRGDAVDDVAYRAARDSALRGRR